MELQELRNEINAIDGEMLALLERRLAVCRARAEYKRQNGLPVRDPARETEKLHEAMEQGGAAGQRLVALLMSLRREEQERGTKGEQRCQGRTTTCCSDGRREMNEQTG